jgi:diacylglycerol kinase family enzyme
MTDITKVIILVNLDANNKRAGRKWSTVSEHVLSKLPADTDVIEYHIPFDIKQCLHDQIVKEKVNCIISAGGDGSANIILNEVVRLQDDNGLELTMGFIGLGSSNDMLKPCETIIGDIPVKINLNKKIKADLGVASIIDKDVKHIKRYFLANSSIGVGANANWLFNQENFIVGFLKSHWLNLAILYVTLKSILTFKNHSIELQYQNIKRNFIISHMSIIKNPNISGDLKFDQEIALDDGNLGLNICENMNKLELMRVLIDLKKSKFSGKLKRSSIFIEDLKIKPCGIITVELDGEIELVKEIHYTIYPGAINILQ